MNTLCVILKVTKDKHFQNLKLALKFRMNICVKSFNFVYGKTNLRIANNNYLIYKDRFNIVIGTKTRTNAIPAIIFYT